MTDRIYRLAASLLITVLVFGIATISYSRAYFGFGTEADFLGGLLPGYMAEASHFLRGEPLDVAFHPPLYVIIIACFQSFLDDWFLTGKLISLLASAIVVVSSYLFYRDVLSYSAALGSVLGLAVSPVFITYGAMATSDVFFVSLYSISLLTAFRATSQNSSSLWIGTGFVLGLALLSRTNALSLLMIVFIPLLDVQRDFWGRAKSAAQIVSGLVVPVILWSGYAAITESHLMPSGTYVNLAITFFAPENLHAWGDGVTYAQQNFDSTWDVLSRDPLGITRRYLQWLFLLPLRLTSIDGLFAYPLNLLVVPAALYLIFSVQERWIFYALVIAIGQIAVVNFKTFEARYYLFLIPLIGASLGHFIGRTFFDFTKPVGTPISRDIVRACLFFIVTVALGNSFITAYERAVMGDAELGEVLGKAAVVVPRGSVIIARKKNVPFYTDSDYAMLPDGGSLEDLRLLALNQSDHAEVFVYYGSVERQVRPGYAVLLDASFDEPWLRREASSDIPRQWVLYRSVRPVLRDN